MSDRVKELVKQVTALSDNEINELYSSLAVMVDKRNKAKQKVIDIKPTPKD